MPRPSRYEIWQYSLGSLRTSLILEINVMSNWHLSKQGICWPVSRDRIAGSRLQLVEVTCFLKLTADQVLEFDWIRGSCQVNLLKTGQDCSERVNGNPGLKVIQIITFSSIQIFCVYGDYKTQNGKPNNKQKTSPQSHRTQIKILPFPGLA